MALLTLGQQRGIRKLNCPWKGPYTIIKRISDATYRVQHQQRQKDRQIVHFNRLKPCPKNIRLNQPTSTPTSPHDQEQLRATGTHSMPQSVMPSDIKLVEEDNVLTPALGTPESNPQPDLPAVRWNPLRERQLPQRYANSVYH